MDLLFLDFVEIYGIDCIAAVYITGTMYSYMKMGRVEDWIKGSLFVLKKIEIIFPVYD